MSLDAIENYLKTVDYVSANRDQIESDLKQASAAA
jgi:hypothetical protein